MQSADAPSSIDTRSLRVASNKALMWVEVRSLSDFAHSFCSSSTWRAMSSVVCSRLAAGPTVNRCFLAGGSFDEEVEEASWLHFQSQTHVPDLLAQRLVEGWPYLQTKAYYVKSSHVSVCQCVSYNRLLVWILARDGKEPSFIGFGSVRVLWVPGFGSARVLVNFLNGGFWFCSGSMTIMVRFGFGFF